MASHYKFIPPLEGDQRVLDYPDYTDFPATGETGVIYIDTGNSDMYLWDGAMYVQQNASAAVWGAIGGTISNQTDLWTYLQKIPTYYRTTSDVTGNAGVDTNLTELSFTLAANKHYYIEVFLRAHTVNAAPASFTHRPTYTGTITALYATVGGATVSNQNITSQPPASATLLGQSITANSGDYAPGMIFISLSTGGSATTYTHAFRSANATSTTIMSGSFIRLTEL